MQWEYLVAEMPTSVEVPRTAESVTEWLNEKGGEGWELIYSPGYGVFYFKRERMWVEKYD